jgi:L-ascorbate metabolism protein UlaG (beta-lactamase superfamily)
MDITYLGHASFRLKGKTSTLITDPFGEYIGIKFPKISADIVTVSHEHNDHSDISRISEVKRVIEGPGEYEVAGVSIIGLPTFHDDKKGSERGRNTIYMIEMDDLRIIHLGDLGHRLSEDMLEELGSVDILLIPVGGVYTIGPTEAGEIVRDIEPSIVIPMHYKVDGLNEESFGKLAKVDDFLTEVAMTVEHADKLSIKKAEIGEDKKVVVLQRRT